MAGVLSEGPAHALLGASSSHRWLECTPSARAESVLPDPGSDYAREGTLAHAMAARRLKQGLGRATDGEDAEIALLRGDYLTEEMPRHVAAYTRLVGDRWLMARERAAARGLMAPEIHIERRLDYSPWAPGGFGTGDAVIVGEGEVEVIDLKYGRGVRVDAPRNPQLMLYALGAVDLFDYAYGIERVTLTICQPRMGHISSWATDTASLTRWAEERVRPAALLAWAGEGERKAGGWCRFCRAKGGCGAYWARDFAGTGATAGD